MKVSVAMSTYNGAKFIREQIVSIIQQTRKVDEIVIYDDASKDDTVRIINEIIEKEKNIDIIFKSNTTNRGAVKNFNDCILGCTGDIIFSSDQDDVWYPEKVEKILKKFNDESVVLVYSDAVVVDEKRQTIYPSLCDKVGRPRVINSQKEFYEQAINGIFPHGCTIAFRRDFFLKVQPCKLLHDNWLPLCAYYQGKVDSVDEPLIEYRQHNNNASGGVKEENIPGMKKWKELRSRMKKTDFQKWFGWPDATYEAWYTYYSMFKDVMDEEIKCNLENRLNLLKTICSFESGCFFVNLYRLYKVRKPYFLYRGNYKSLMIDVWYCMLKCK